MADAIKVPKFRKVSRIASWMEKNMYYDRIPQAEELFLKTNDDAHIVLSSLIDYQDKIDGDLPKELQDLLYSKAKESIPPADENIDYLIKFFRYCHNNIHKDYINKYLDLFEGKSERLMQWAQWTNERLPTHLEDSISDPQILLQYAVEILKGRLPTHLEDVFHKDVHAATGYAFGVIRGFAPVRLPDNLHNFIIMESFKQPNDRYIKDYMRACESDPNKIGNSVNDVTFHSY